MAAAPPAPVPVAPGARLQLLAQVAAVFVRPLSWLSDQACAAALPDGTDLAKVTAVAPFRHALNRAVATQLGLGAIPIDDDFVWRLEQRPGTRLCALLASQPRSILSDASRQIAAAFLHKRVVGVVLRAERERLKAIFGEDAFRVATDEAALLHAPLATAAEPSATAGLLGDLTDAAAAQVRIVDFGLRMLSRFVAVVEPVLLGVFQMRLPEPLGSEPGGLGRLTPEQCDHVIKLLRRRVPAWAPIIG